MYARRVMTALALLAFAATSVVGHPSASAAGFDPQHILSDAEIRHSEAMSLADISFFLARRGGLGAVNDFDAVDGELKSAAELIRAAAVRYDINPQYILALLQKESSIVETTTPTQRQLDWAAGYALCDGCRVDDPLPLKYKGFAKQVDAGAGWMDWFLKGAGAQEGLGQAGEGRIINGTVITPANAVTAALYNYTPHLHGNELLWKILQRWFATGSGRSFPDGTLVRNRANGAVAAILGGRFRPILKQSVLVTRFRSANIVDLDAASFASLERGERGPAIRFPDLSLVQTEDADRYLLIGNRKRHIPTAQDFARLGFNPEEIEMVAAADIADYALGEPLLADASFPLGELLQDPVTGGVYYAESGTKRPLLDRAFLTVNFGGRSITTASRSTLESLKTGAPIGFPDGTLLKAPADPVVYLISGGKKRSFATERDFKTLGFKFANVITASAKSLALHETGEPIDLALPDPNAPIVAADSI